MESDVYIFYIYQLKDGLGKSKGEKYTVGYGDPGFSFIYDF